MNKSFVKELIITNYLFIGSLIMIVLAGNIVYGGTLETWSKSLGLLAVLTLALVFKTLRIKRSGGKLDERLQLITYRAVNFGFYFILGAVFWFYTKELIVEGQVSTRTIIEMLAGMTGYVGSFFALSKRY